MISKEITAFLWVSKSNVGLCLLSLMHKLALGVFPYVLPEASSTSMVVLEAFFPHPGIWAWTVFHASQQLATILNFAHLEKLPYSLRTRWKVSIRFTEDQDTEAKELDSSEDHSLKSPVPDGFWAAGLKQENFLLVSMRNQCGQPLVLNNHGLEWPVCFHWGWLKSSTPFLFLTTLLKSSPSWALHQGSEQT